MSQTEPSAWPVVLLNDTRRELSGVIQSKIISKELRFVCNWVENLFSVCTKLLHEISVYSMEYVIQELSRSKEYIAHAIMSLRKEKQIVFLAHFVFPQ